MSGVEPGGRLMTATQAMAAPAPHPCNRTNEACDFERLYLKASRDRADLRQLVNRLANPDAGELLTLDDYRQIARALLAMYGEAPAAAPFEPRYTCGACGGELQVCVRAWFRERRDGKLVLVEVDDGDTEGAKYCPTCNDTDQCGDVVVVDRGLHFDRQLDEDGEERNKACQYGHPDCATEERGECKNAGRDHGARFQYADGCSTDD